MLANTTGSQNTAVGVSALRNNTTGFGNIAIGQDACSQSQGGQNNTGVGWQALVHNAGNFNTANGAGALSSNTTGNDNTANGVGTLSSNISGGDNVASGLSALSNNTNGDLNVAYGVDALLSNTTGAVNTAIGVSALQNNITGTGNIALGGGAGSAITTADFVIAIGEDVAGANVSGSCFIGNIRGVTTANADAIPVLIDSFGQLGTISSSRRFKKKIKPMDKASEAILALKPVTFQYKSDTKNTPQFGLIAEEVAEVSPDLVVRNRDGEIYTVRYDAVNAMLLNEFLKEHGIVQELKSAMVKQEATIARLTNGFQTVSTLQQNEIRLLSAQLNEQAAQIQKVSAQLKLNKVAPQTVRNND